MKKYSLLSKINTPEDLKRIDPSDIKKLCGEIREEIISTVCKNGGHLASNLGAVELTVAIHRCFDSPRDSIIFDVGHQCYTHKLLTGRREQFNTLRTEGGISGFTRPEESCHDTFVSGHSSTSISAALGLINAKRLLNDDSYVIAVIGDGALSGGLAYEALNNAGRRRDNRLVVILNDNKMSISKNVGAMARHLAVIRSRPSYFQFKTGIESFLIKIPIIGLKLRNTVVYIKKHFKNLLYNSTIFEDMGFSYLGPIDGHDENALEDCLLMAKQMNRPVFIHVHTVKGKGCDFAEKHPENYHAVSKGTDEKTGESKPSNGNFSKHFGNSLCSMASESQKICAVTAAMTDGTGLADFAKQYPDRFFDVGIAEEHAVTFCSGLSKGGFTPVLAVYSSFIQRGCDEIIHDIAVQNLKAVLCIDRAGFVGEDGETHQGLLDVALFSCIPDVKIYAPAYYDELDICLEKAVNNDTGLSVVRYPRGGELPRPDRYKPSCTAFYATGDAGDVCIVTYGRIASNAFSAAERLNEKGIKIVVIKLNRIYPIDEKAVDLAGKFKRVFFFEEGIKSGGIAEKFEAYLAGKNYNGSVHITAVDNKFVPQATVESCLHKYRLDSDGMFDLIVNGE